MKFFHHIVFCCCIFTMGFSVQFYKIWRSEVIIVNAISIPVFGARDCMHTEEILNEKTKGSLPSLLWTFLWGNITIWLWFEEWGKWYLQSFWGKFQLIFWCMLPFPSCVCWEYLQAVNCLPGTSDRMDILFGLVGYILCWCEVALLLLLNTDSTIIQEN